MRYWLLEQAIGLNPQMRVIYRSPSPFGRGHRQRYVLKECTSVDIDRFWQIIEESRRGADANSPGGNMDRQLKRLTELLTALSPEDVVEFDRHFTERFIEAYRWDLWAAAYIIEGGCSDDGFMDFRRWLISMGRSAYNDSLRDVEMLVKYASDPTVEVCSFEEIGYVPTQVYGKPIVHAIARPAEPIGDKWEEDPDELSRRFPKLWEKFGD